MLLVAVAYTQEANSETQAGANKTATEASDSGSRTSSTVPFLGLRNITGSEKPTEFFGDSRSILRAGHCKLFHTSLDSLKPVSEKASFYIPDEIVKLDSISLTPIDGFWWGLQNTLQGRAPVLYVHGFFTSFERGCRRASLLQDSLDLSGQLVLFSWPSDGTMFNYTHDESDLYWSVDPLHRIMLEMVDRFGTGKANVLAHSLGARGVMLALVRLVQAKQSSEPLFNHVVLIAPDIDAGVFEQYLPMIRPLAQNITVYTSSNDSPLALSSQVHGYPRLGQAGAHLEGLSGIDIVDISEVPIRVPSGHVYHLYNNIVIDDLNQLINENKPAAQRRNLTKSGENQWRYSKPALD